MNIILEIFVQCDTNTDLNLYVYVSDLYCMVLWFCLISWRLFAGRMPILIPCDAKIYLIKCMWVSDLHFMVQWFCVICWKLFKCCTGDIDSVWHKHWTETIYKGQWPIFHCTLILPYILKTIWWTNVIIGILDLCDAKIYHIKCMWVSDLHVMVQCECVCLISWRLFAGLMMYWRDWFNVTQTLNWNYICRPVTYISWFSDFALYLADYLMDKCQKWNIGSMWCKE